MNKYILVRKSQALNYFKTPLYIKNQNSGYVLYKADNKSINKNQYFDDNYPELYIHDSDRQDAKNELQTVLKKTLINKIQTGNINDVKTTVCDIIAETFTDIVENSIESLPETIDIMYEGYSKTSDLLRGFHEINYAGYPLVNHTANVMSIALIYCIKNGFSEVETKRISLCALLHDVGLTKLPRGLVAYSGRLPDHKFKEYKTHTAIGHDIVKQCENIDSSIAVGILEHHERLDGNGYPRGIAHISFEGRLIGLIDSFDSLTNSEKSFRAKRKPFDAMILIKDEVIKKGLFDKNIFIDLCQSLGKKIS